MILTLLWVFRKGINIGFMTTPGWSSLFKNPNFINDGTIAIFIAVLLFVTPSSEKNKALVSWKIIKKIPLNRLAKPEDSANLISFLLSDEASYITGQIIKIDGGLSLI